MSTMVAVFRRKFCVAMRYVIRAVSQTYGLLASLSGRTLSRVSFLFMQSTIGAVACPDFIVASHTISMLFRLKTFWISSIGCILARASAFYVCGIIQTSLGFMCRSIEATLQTDEFPFRFAIRRMVGTMRFWIFVWHGALSSVESLRKWHGNPLRRAFGLQTLAVPCAV